MRLRTFVVVGIVVACASCVHDLPAQSPTVSLEAAIDLFFAAKPNESARMFDAIVKARPTREPELWQRGLAALLRQSLQGWKGAI